MMIKNPLKFWKTKKLNLSRQDDAPDVIYEKDQEEEDLDIATEALEDLSISSKASVDIEIKDDDVQSQSSEASTLALLSTASNSTEIEQVGCEPITTSR